MFGESRTCHKIADLFLAGLVLLMFVLIIGPAIIVAVITSQFFRWIFILYVKIFRKDIVRIMSGNSPVMAIDDSQSPTQCTIVCYGVLEGASAEHLIQLTKNSFLESDPVTERFVHPEFQQYFEQWMGFIWWKWEQHFKLEKHVLVLEEGRDKCKPLSEKDLMKLIATLETKPFRKEQSPWEVVIVENLFLENIKNPDLPKAAIIFRFHHGFADGLSILQIFMKFMFIDTMDKIQKPAASKRRSVFEKLVQSLKILQLPFLFVKQFVCASDSNEWHILQTKLSRKMYRACSKRIPISLIKDIKDQFKVAFTAVLISVVTVAVRKMMIKHNVDVPKRMNAIVPLPWPNHPQTVCNHWSSGFYELPTGERNTPQILVRVHNYIHSMKDSWLPALNFFFLTLANMLPTWLIKIIDIPSRFPTILLSNFPGPPPDSIGLGYKLVDAMFTLGPFRGSIGIHITIMSYDDAVRIAVGVDSSIFRSQDMADDFIEMIEKAFDDFYEAKLHSIL